VLFEQNIIYFNGVIPFT